MASVDVRKNKTGEIISYRVRWRFRGAQQTVTVGDDKAAERMRKAIEARGHEIPQTDPDIQDLSIITGIKPRVALGPLFDDVAEKYIASRAKASADTKNMYRETVRNRMHELKGEPIEWITADRLQLLLNDLADRGQSPVMTYDMLGSIFKYAINRGILRNGNPFALVEMPTWEPKPAAFLTPDEASIIVDACEQVGGQTLRDLVDGILGTGLRISEALGLIVDDVHVEDLMNAWIDVAYQLADVPVNQEPFRKPTKTRRGRRRIALDEDTAIVFARAVKGKRPEEPVFANPETGGWWRQYPVRHLWTTVRKIAHKAGMIKRPRLHDLRHTHAGWLLTDNVPILAVSRRLGHTGITITVDTYGHLLPEGDDAIRASLVRRRAQMAAKPANPKPTSGPRGRTGESTSPPARTTQSRNRKTSTAGQAAQRG